MCRLQSVLLFGLFSIFAIDVGIVATDVIKAVALLTRHGDRSPFFPYPYDPHKFYKWPGGFSALSSKGVRELFKSGLIKAERYQSLLSEGQTSNIYARSSAVERCIISAESFLDGFLPGVYLNVSVHIPVGFDDTMLTWPGKLCRRFDADSRRSMSLKQPDVLALSQNGEVIRYLKNNTGQVIPDLNAVLTIVDTLTIERDKGLQMPAWVDGVYDDHLIPLAELAMLKTCSTKRSYTKTGVLLDDVINRMDDFIYDDNPQNIWFYSAHDMTVQGLLVVLGVFDQVGHKPDYAATVAMELHSEGSGIEVKIFYFRNAIDINPIEIRIPDCPSPCFYGRFKRLISSKLVPNFDEVCKLSSAIKS